MDEEMVLAYYHAGIDCSQVVFGYGAELMGMDRDLACKIAAAFGGGMYHGMTCGCVTGALMAIGARYGHCRPGDRKTKADLLRVKERFEEQFIERCGSLVCKELLGVDVSDDQGKVKAMEDNLMDVKCPYFACIACEIMEGLI